MPTNFPPAKAEPAAAASTGFTLHLDHEEFEFYVELPSDYTEELYDAAVAAATAAGLEIMDFDESEPEERPGGLVRLWATPLEVDSQ